MPASPLHWPCLLLVSAQIAGCAAGQYTFGKPDHPTPGVTAERAYSRGDESPRLDRFERLVDSPSRLPFIPDPPPDTPSEETLDALDRYLDQNSIHDLHIAIEEYSPSSQWSRLTANRQMSAFWRYPIGSVTCVFSAIIPDRVFDRTAYNPYTNTLVINSDNEAEILAAAAYAKSLRTRHLRGPYALLASIPIVSIFHDVDVANDVLTYARHEDDWELERDAYRELYPRIASEAAVTAFNPSSILFRPLIAIGGGALGRSVAELQIRRVAPDRVDEMPMRLEDKVDQELLAASEPPSEVRQVDAVFRDDEPLRRVVFPESEAAMSEGHSSWQPDAKAIRRK